MCSRAARRHPSRPKDADPVCRSPRPPREKLVRALSGARSPLRKPVADADDMGPDLPIPEDTSDLPSVSSFAQKTQHDGIVVKIPTPEAPESRAAQTPWMSSTLSRPSIGEPV